jgi:tetratricopeptide (TPR) repeat protein
MKLAISLAAAIFATAPTALAPGMSSSLVGIGFICGAEDATDSTVGAATGVMLPGVGNGTYAVDTANPDAAAWFNHALRLYHAFAHDEAKAAFARAAALDPNCSLCASGVALSLGPTLNTGITPAETIIARDAAKRALAMAKPDDARAKGLATALLARYAETPPPSGGREKAFGRQLDELYKANPSDVLVANLAAHALIIPARQDDFSGVERSIAIIEAVLKGNPDDAAAIHYYIHATEFAQRAPLALPYAERLADLAPGSGHLVHMGTHTMMRVGHYQDVALSNARALKVDVESQSTLPTSGSLAQRYYLHNYLFGLSGALMAGDEALALRYADHAEKGFKAAGLPRNRVMSRARSLVALGRYAPDRALAVPQDPDDTRFLRIYRHYARGEAFAVKGDAAGVRREAEAIRAVIAQGAQTGDLGGESEMAAVAEGVLRGRAAMVAGKPEEAVRHFAQAAAAQEKAYPVPKNFDPPPWWYPVRRSLAAAHLKAGRNAEAVREAKASLVEWPQDGLALRILEKADKAQAAQWRAQARKAYIGDVAKVPLELT